MPIMLSGRPDEPGTVQFLTNSYRSVRGSQMLVKCSFGVSLKFRDAIKLENELHSVPDTEQNREIFHGLYAGDTEIKLIATFNS